MKKEIKKRKKIKRIMGAIILGGILAMTVGCERKGSREWIENKVADIEKVYPTEKLEDLFEKFPNGFVITQTRLFKDNGKNYSIDLEMKGNKDTKKIQGEVRKIRLQSDPYKETTEKESKVKYVKGKGLVLEKEELTKELLPKNYFLFQKLKLNKDILKGLEVKGKAYSFETSRYEIFYTYKNKNIAEYLGVDENINLEITGRDGIKNYFHVVGIKKDELEFHERIIGEKGE
ncbi:hypothetical protein [Gemella cuniculi]